MLYLNIHRFNPPYSSSSSSSLTTEVYHILRLDMDMDMADWSALLPELVVEIAKGITFHEDFVSFSHVCCSWQSAINGSNWNRNDDSHLPSRYPSLLIMDDRRQESNIHYMDGSVHRVQLPAGSTVFCRSSTGGWVLLLELHKTLPKLFHPLSGRQIDLPDFKNICSEADEEDEVEVYLRKVFLSSDPTLDPFVIVIVASGGKQRLAFCKLGDSSPSWTPVRDGFNCAVADLCYYKGKAYTFDNRVLILSCDLYSQIPRMLQVSKKSVFELEDGIGTFNFDYILPLCDEEHEKLLVVCHRFVRHPLPEEEKNNWAPVLEEVYGIEPECAFDLVTESFCVYECDIETGELSKVDSLGNRAIFVGLCSSFIMEASGAVKANCIYFTDNTGNILFTDKWVVGKLDMGIYHLSDGRMERQFVRPVSECNNPMWIAPPVSFK